MMLLSQYPADCGIYPTRSHNPRIYGAGLPSHRLNMAPTKPAIGELGMDRFGQDRGRNPAGVGNCNSAKNLPMTTEVTVRGKPLLAGNVRRAENQETLE